MPINPQTVTFIKENLDIEISVAEVPINEDVSGQVRTALIVRLFLEGNQVAKDECFLRPVPGPSIPVIPSGLPPQHGPPGAGQGGGTGPSF